MAYGKAVLYPERLRDAGRIGGVWAMVVLSNTTFGELWKSATKGTGNLLLGSGDSIGWHLDNAEERSQFWQLCTNPLYMEGASSTSGSTVSLVYYSPTAAQVDADSVYYHFIAADCGDQPTTTGSPSLRYLFEEDWFPDLVRCEWSITGGATDAYNCIAWSVGETFVWYNKLHTYPGTNILGIDEEYGNPENGILDLTDMDNFYYIKKGWTPFTSGADDEERASQAEAMYYSQFHGARKKSCGCGGGKWIMYESKCGPAHRIEHVWNQLNGTDDPDDYGVPIRFYH